MKKYFFTLLFLFFTKLIISQSLTAKIVDTNNNPIAFATIQTEENKGVISNEEGIFTVNLNENTIKEIKISSLGFSSVTLRIEEIIESNNTIVLKEHLEILDQVYVSNSRPNANEIIKKVNENLNNNYSHTERKYNLFFRSTALVDFNTLNFEIDKVSGQKRKQLEDANNELKVLTNSIKTSEAVFFRDYIADLYIKDFENKKLNVHKATTLLDKNRSFSIDAVQEKAQSLILKYLDTTLTYKLKSGLFKIEDSLSLKKEQQKEQQKDSIKTFTTEELTSETYNLFNASTTIDKTRLRSILNSELYDYKFKEITVFDGKIVYEILYEPRKSKAKFTGKLYITDEDFAVIKLDYKYAKGKRGQKVNLKLLLGVKYVENIRIGTILYKKNPDNYYQPYYISEKMGSFFYVNRPLKLIENSRKKNKIGLNFKIEGVGTYKNEIYIIQNSKIDDAIYNSINIKEEIPYQELKAYDPTIWEKYNALEPLEEMKKFKSLEN